MSQECHECLSTLTHTHIESEHKAHLAKASTEAGRAWQRARVRMIMAEATGDDEVPNPGLRIRDQLVNAQWLTGWLAAGLFLARVCICAAIHSTGGRGTPPCVCVCMNVCPVLLNIGRTRCLSHVKPEVCKNYL